MRNYYEILKIDPTVESEEIIRSLELERNRCNQKNNMSRQEIAVAIEELEEVEKILLDPIKRAEYNRKLQKEQRNREYREQISREQRELQSFAIDELPQVKTQVTEIPIVECDRETKIKSGDLSHAKVTEEISSDSEDRREQETVIITEPNQPSTTSISPTELTSLKSSGLTKWQQSMLTGVVMGSFVLVGLVLLKPNSSSQLIVQESAETRSPSSTTANTQVSESSNSNNSSQTSTLYTPKVERDRSNESSQTTTSDTQQDLTQEDAANLIEKWQNAKREIFAPPFNRQLGTELLTGKAYYDNIGKPDGSVGWLENNYSHYTYGVQSVNSVENFEKNGNYATIDAVITEERTLHNGNGSIDRKASGFDTRLVRYSLKSDNGQWKIADYHTVRKIKTR